MFRIMFFNIRKLSLHILAGLAFLSNLEAQTPTDGIMMKGREICIAAIWSQDKWDEYWEGSLLRTNGNIGTFSKNAYSLMVAGGITERINLLVSLPYLKTDATGGQLTGVQGFQDFGLWGKAVLYKKQLGPGVFTTQGVLGFTTPVTNYLPDYAPFSLGLGCTEGQGRVILQYLFDMGLYARVSGAYFLRGTSTIERDYYYTTNGIYSDKVDVPNANQMIANLGWWLFNDKLKLEAAYEKFNTIGGFDIRRQEPGFPSNNMEASAVNGHVQYYTPLRGLGFFGTYSQVLEGRNVGKASSIVAGITYQFGISPSKQNL